MLKQVYHIVAVFVVLFLALTNSVFATEQKRQLRILTSMSERVYGPYVLEFEKLYPDIDVLVLNKNTNHALGQIDAMAADSFGCAFAYHQNGFGTLRDQDRACELYFESFGQFNGLVFGIAEEA